MDQIYKGVKMFNWAQPVTSTKWAIICLVLDTLKRWSGYRLFVGSSHQAWVNATR